MHKKIKIFVWSFAIMLTLLVFGYVLFLLKFNLFEPPKESTRDTRCDYEGLRKVTLTSFNGNATVLEHLKIKANLCMVKESVPELLFNAKGPQQQLKKVSFKWKTFDTVVVQYPKTLFVLLKKEQTETIHPPINVLYSVK